MKKVTFGTTLIVAHPLSPDGLWYNKEEYGAIRLQAKAEMNNSQNAASPRGLELIDDASGCCTDSATQRKNHSNSILALQEDHQDHGIIDTRGLQTLSLALSKEASKRAQLRAVEDAIQAFAIHAEKNSLYCMKVGTAEEYAQKTRRRISLRSQQSRLLSCC